MRISQELATSIATKLTEKSAAVIPPLKEELNELVTSLYEGQIPEIIKKAHIAHPEWFKLEDSIKLEGHGFSRYYVDTTRDVVVPIGPYPEIKLNAKLAAQIRTAKNKLEKAEQTYKKLLNDTERALRNLGTTKRISEVFPDAIPYLPTAASPGLPSVIVDMNALKKRLANQPDIEVPITA